MRNSALGKGDGGGGTDCHSQCVHGLRNDTVFTRGAVCGGTHGSRPTTAHFCRAGPVCPAVGAVQDRRADRGVRPYGSATRGAMGGRPQGSPLRKRYKGCGIRPGGSSGRPTPTHHSPIELRRGRRPRRPALPWARCGLTMTHYKKCGTNPAGDRKGRPYGNVGTPA